jgi:integrase
MATLQEIQNRIAFRREIAKLTFDQLGQISVTVNSKSVLNQDSLRSIAAKIGLTAFEQDGETYKSNNAKKSILVQAIWDDLEEERQAHDINTAIDTEAVKTIATEANDVTETDLGQLAKIAFDKIVSYTDSLWNHGDYKPTDSYLISITGDIARLLQNRTSGKTGGYLKPETVMSYKSTLKALVLKMVEEQTANHHYPKYLEIFNMIFGCKRDGRYIRGELDKALTTQSTAKGISGNHNLSVRKGNQSIANVARLYDFALETLGVLLSTDNPKSNELWQKVAISLMLVTGRRLSEIMSTAKFTPSDRGGWVVFEGQLKTKGNEVVKPYPIPTVVDFETIDSAMNWLRSNGKHNLDPDKAHQNYSKPLSATTKALDSWIDYIERETVVKEGGIEKPRMLTSHTCRQIYAQIWKESAELEGAPHHRISTILGHGKEDNGTALRYDADIEVRDARAILTKLGRAVR